MLVLDHVHHQLDIQLSCPFAKKICRHQPMYKAHYLDPLGSRLPALERNILRLRSMQMVLVLFYVEQIKQQILDMIQKTDGLKARMGTGSERVPKDAKQQIKKCLNALVADGVISDDEKNEIKKLIDYRNLVGHEIHELVADVSSERYIRRMLDFSPRRISSYDYNAVDRLRHYLELLSRKQITHHYIVSVGSQKMMFKSAERTLLADISKLRRKIDKLSDIRDAQIDRLNEQISAFESLVEENNPQYDNNRLTRRGQEVCYRMFDLGQSAMAVAHLMGISLAAARKRYRSWSAAGAEGRLTVDLESLPRRRFLHRYKD
jgi:hypothetical protein